MAGPLANLCVVDFTHRLPGPLASLQLCKLGADVYKIEDQTYKDPFITEAFLSMDDSFSYWYDELNKNKKVIRIDFKNPDASSLSELIEKADIILMGLSLKLQQKLNVTFNDLLKIKKKGVFLEMASSQSEQTPMHDLNALAMQGLLKMHLPKASTKKWLSPPFFPVAGMAFAAHTALKAMSLLHSNKEGLIHETSYLDEACDSLMGPLYPQKLQEKDNRFLHNGRYPCYSLYPLNDGNYLACASVELKFWQKFCDIFNLELTNEDRFYDQDNSIFELICLETLKYDSTQVQELIKNTHCCLNLVMA